MFVLNIKCHPDMYDITLDPDKTVIQFKVRIILRDLSRLYRL